MAITHITVRREKNYGIEVFYPEDEAAKLFANVAQTSTMTRRTLDAIKRFGIQINVVHPTVTL